MRNEAPPGAGPGRQADGTGRRPGIAIWDEPSRCPICRAAGPCPRRPSGQLGRAGRPPGGPRTQATPARRRDWPPWSPWPRRTSSPPRTRQAPAIGGSSPAGRYAPAGRPAGAAPGPRRRHSRRPVSAIPLRQRLAYGVLLAGGLFLAGRFAIFWFNPARLPRDFGPRADLGDLALFAALTVVIWHRQVMDIIGWLICRRMDPHREPPRPPPGCAWPSSRRSCRAVSHSTCSAGRWPA